MEEDLVKKLSDFGFTVNQAKVYLSIVQSGLTCVSRISESTRLHRQDIYKILLKLEKMGLITKRIDKPVMIEAFPVEKAINRLVSIEREKANERTSLLEANSKELINAVKEQQESGKTQEEEARFILLTTDEQIMNMADLTFENTKIECDMVTSLELMTRRMSHFREHFQKLSSRGVRTRVIVENLNNEGLVRETLEKIRPTGDDFAARLIYKSRSLPYRIIDNKELFIRRKKVTKSGLPFVLFTNSKNMVQFYKENFDEAWNDPRAISIYSAPARGRTTQEQDGLFTFLTTDDAIKYKANLACANAKIEYDLVTNLEQIPQRSHCLYELQALARRGAKIRIIVENLNNEDLVKRNLEKIRPTRGNFAAKLSYKSSSMPYQIIDHKEVWIPTQKKTESSAPCFLWTNDKNLVQFYEEKFKDTWNDPRTISIYPERDIVEERISKSSVSA